MRPLDQTLFVICWETSESIAEVAATLADAGHPEMTARKVLCVGWALRKFGVELKHLPRPYFPRQDLDLSSVALTEFAHRLVRQHAERRAGAGI